MPPRQRLLCARSNGGREDALGLNARLHILELGHLLWGARRGDGDRGRHSG